jgi:hypothetical protein
MHPFVFPLLDSEEVGYVRTSHFTEEHCYIHDLSSNPWIRTLAPPYSIVVLEKFEMFSYSESGSCREMYAATFYKVGHQLASRATTAFPMVVDSSERRKPRLYVEYANAAAAVKQARPGIVYQIEYKRTTQTRR